METLCTLAKHPGIILKGQLSLIPNSHASFIQVFTRAATKSTVTVVCAQHSILRPRRRYLCASSWFYLRVSAETSGIAAWDISSNPSTDLVQENQFYEFMFYIYICIFLPVMFTFFFFLCLVFSFFFIFFISSHIAFSFSLQKSCLSIYFFYFFHQNRYF